MPENVGRKLYSFLHLSLCDKWMMGGFKPPRSEEGSLRGLESRAHCVGFSVMKIGNRKERLRVREAGASAAGRGQRPYASFPDKSLRQVWAAAQS